MPIVNRTLDASEQRKAFGVNAGAVATGVSGIICMVPYPATIDAAEIAAFGLSGAPTYSLVVNRFVVGAGVTAITVVSGQAVSAFGTSGPQGVSLPAAGSSLLNVLPNDVLMYQSAGANTAVTGLSVNVVLKPIQDIKIHFAQV